MDNKVDENGTSYHIQNMADKRYWVKPKKHLIISIMLVVLIILSAASVLDRPFKGLDEKATGHINKTLIRAGSFFAMARGLNAIISVIQSSEIGFSFIGQTSIAIGELFDPLNDLIEKFSSVMLVSTVSLGIQKILLEIGKWIGIKIFLTSSLILFLIVLLLPDRITGIKQKIGGIAFKVLIFAIVVRFAVPVIAVVSSSINTVFLEDKYNTAKSVLDKANEEVKETNQFLEKYELKEKDSDISNEDIYLKTENNDSSAKEGEEKDRFKLFNKKKKEKREIESESADKNEPVYVKNKDVKKIKFNFKNIMGKFGDALKNITNHIIDLIVIFILQTIIIPIVTLWGLLQLTKFLFREQVYASATGVVGKLFQSKSHIQKTLREDAEQREK